MRATMAAVAALAGGLFLLATAHGPASATSVPINLKNVIGTTPGSVELVRQGGGVVVVAMAVAAVAPEGAQARLIRIGGFHIDVAPRDSLVILTNNDVPGVIGRVGTLLGDRGVNIAEYHQARLAQGGEALAAISVDGSVPAGIRDELLNLPDVCTATIVQFRGA